MVHIKNEHIVFLGEELWRCSYVQPLEIPTRSLNGFYYLSFARISNIMAVL